MDRDVPRCRLDDRVGDVGDAEFCVVLNDHGVVMGVLDTQARHEHPGALAGDVMRFGVSTVRPNEEQEALVERMERRGVRQVVVTRQDGVLVGVFRLPRA